MLANIIKKCFKKGVYLIKSCAKDIIALRYFITMKRKINTEKKIKVGFIVQMYEIWDKTVSVYNEMKRREEFETFILVVPPYNLNTKQISSDYTDNPFIAEYPDAIKALDDTGNVIDISGLSLDYVFYPRPYDHYLPLKLRSYQLFRKIKCCYIPYGFSGAPVFNGGNSNPDFFRYIYAAFLDSDYMKNLMISKFRFSAFAKLKYFENLGYPSLEPYFNKRTTEKHKTILWTPRWSYDERIGGSHFLELKDIIFKIKEQHNDWNLIFRPHPLMFEEFISKKIMSQNEVDEYLEQLRTSGIIYDHSTSIEEAIDNADILITDYSSIIVNFYLTGKPIIYCRSNIELNEIFGEMFRSVYIAEKENDAERFVNLLIEGKDDLKEARLETINKLFSDCNGAASRISDWIIDDYKKGCKAE